MGQFRVAEAAKVIALMIRTRRIVALMMMMHGSILLSNRCAHAAPNTAPGTSQADRVEAISTIPFDKLDVDARNKARAVIGRTSIYRRLPEQIVDCDPRYFIFLVRHPEIVVNIWRKMEATDLLIKRKSSERFFATDNAGTIGNLEFLYGDHAVHLLYCQGSYTGSLTARPIRADCLLVLKSEYVPHENGRHYVASRVDLFVSIHNSGIDLLARTFKGLIGRTTDYNFVQTANFITKLARTTEANGPGVQRLAEQLDGLDAEVREKFYDMAGIVYEKAQKRMASHATAKTASASDR